MIPGYLELVSATHEAKSIQAFDSRVFELAPCLDRTLEEIAQAIMVE